MHVRLKLASGNSIMSVAAAALAGLSASGVLSVIVNHFKRRGAAMKRVVTAERVCAPLAYR